MDDSLDYFETQFNEINTSEKQRVAIFYGKLSNIREKLVEFPRSLVKTDSYRLIAYPGKPYEVEAPYSI